MEGKVARLWLTIPEVSRATGIHQTNFYRWAASGKLKVVEFPATVLVDVDALLDREGNADE